MTREEKIEAVARLLCGRSGYDPDRLMPGLVPIQPSMDEPADGNTDFVADQFPYDGELPNGDVGSFWWRDYIFDAQAVINLLESEGPSE
ncbi:hypothetical protein [Parvularcula sp. LCG005]|uniref:hypothetical protein n=1 Tax=Parvularcula sp. LCG005 TaxID=3078805 RepID=UPI002943D2AA|nr:hypothetical protein [Parvularcula sp. LCG005]WOI54283.1 hypothetical protein RUI03_04605 [Parvularcula sp. LCG005]